MKCHYCEEKKDLMKAGKEANGKQRFRCRPCNTKILQKYRITINGKKASMKAVLKYNFLNSDRVKAWSYVNNSNLKFSKIPCYCRENKVDAHHKNPLNKEDVVWLCRAHHKKTHTDFNYLKNYYA